MLFFSFSDLITVLYLDRKEKRVIDAIKIVKQSSVSLFICNFFFD